MGGDDENEGHVERLINTVKECKIYDSHNMPYNKYPKLMVVSSL